jgi:hypothetical protein
MEGLTGPLAWMGQTSPLLSTTPPVRLESGRCKTMQSMALKPEPDTPQMIGWSRLHRPFDMTGASWMFVRCPVPQPRGHI